MTPEEHKATIENLWDKDGEPCLQSMAYAIATLFELEELSIEGERWLVYPLELPVYLCESERHRQTERAEFKLACPETGGCRVLCAACLERLRRGEKRGSGGGAVGGER